MSPTRPKRQWGNTQRPNLILFFAVSLAAGVSLLTIASANHTGEDVSPTTTLRSTEYPQDLSVTDSFEWIDVLVHGSVTIDTPYIRIAQASAEGNVTFVEDSFTLFDPFTSSGADDPIDVGGCIHVGGGELSINVRATPEKQSVVFATCDCYFGEFDKVTAQVDDSSCQTVDSHQVTEFNNAVIFAFSLQDSCSGSDAPLHLSFSRRLLFSLFISLSVPLFLSSSHFSVGSFAANPLGLKRK
eukprot:TRINITY_DN4755_c0_g1_i1.p1 TRINITY_DN4755_c0_g1~~TRINITY_DN4755_c0_g1_i1.p1  ORF type:complete len:242 (-),score=44.62 TRINITY_DN4755_c0_g1_i1:185-910(-)